MVEYERCERNWALNIQRILIENIPEPEQMIISENKEIMNLNVHTVQPNSMFEDEVNAIILNRYNSINNVVCQPDSSFMDNDNIIEPQIYNDAIEVDLERQNNDDGNIGLCKLCSTDWRLANETFIMVPCGHGWICGNCKSILDVDGARCILCGLEEIMFLRVYL